MNNALLPKLKTDQVNVLPTVLGLEQMRGAQQQNKLNALKLKDYQSDREARASAQEFERKIKALNVAQGAASPEEARGIYKNLTGEELKFSFKGKDVEIVFADGTTLKGPSGAVKDAINKISQNPELVTDPTLAPRTFGFLGGVGITVSNPKVTEIADLAGAGVSVKAPQKEKRKVGETRTYQKKGETITEEYDGQQWKEIGRGPKWNPKETDKPDLTEAQARAKLVDVAKYRQKLKSTGGFDELLFGMIQKENPELAQKLRGADTSQVEIVLEDYENYLKGFVSKSDPLGIR